MFRRRMRNLPPDTYDGAVAEEMSVLAADDAAVLRSVARLTVIVVALAAICGALGFLLAWQSDENLAAQQRQSLRNAVAEVQRQNPDAPLLTQEQMALIAESANLKGLRLSMQESSSADRDLRQEMPAHDRLGRIAGWLSWDVERPAHDMVWHLWPPLALAVIGVLGLCMICLRALRRMHCRLQEKEAAVRSARDAVGFDIITGAPNQTGFRQLVNDTIARRRDDEVVTLGYIDIDRFGEVNQVIGTRAADRLLGIVAERLIKMLPPGSAIGRVGGDCFGFVLTTNSRDTAAAMIAAAVREVSRPYRIAPVANLTVSTGFASVPDHGKNREELAQCAGLALQSARDRRGGAIASFSNEMARELAERRFIRRELVTALADNLLDLHYQPIVSASDREVVGVEALLRWRHPERGDIQPSDFVRIAEQAGLMTQLGQFVLRRALADAARWPGAFIAVNLSPLQVRDEGFVDYVAKLLEDMDFDASRLVLEITEGVLIDEPEQTRERLDALRALGVRLALDDFGSGYSNLSYLRSLPIDKLKIDRSFVPSFGASSAGVIIQAIVALGHALNMTVLVEGVETEQQRVLLRLAGCDEMQGFLFARPAPAAAIDAMLDLAARPVPAARIRSGER